MASRRDGRHPHRTRPPQISLSLLSRSDGSARFTFGPTGPSALSSVSGPIEVRLASENASQATLEVLVRPLSHVPATEAKALGTVVRGLLEPSLVLSMNPRTMVQVVAQAMSPGLSRGSNGGFGDGLIAAIINASVLALLNAGSIPMRGVVCGVAVGRRKVDGVFIVDPDEKEEGEVDVHGCFAFMFSGGPGDLPGLRARCVWSNWRTASGRTFDEAVLREARELAGKAAEGIYAAMFQSLEGKEDDDRMEI